MVSDEFEDPHRCTSWVDFPVLTCVLRLFPVRMPEVQEPKSERGSSIVLPRVTSGQKGTDTPAEFACVQIGGMQGSECRRTSPPRIGFVKVQRSPHMYWPIPASGSPDLRGGLSLGALDWARDPGRDRVSGAARSAIPMRTLCVRRIIVQGVVVAVRTCEVTE